MPIKINITDEEFQIIKHEPDGTITENLTWETPEGLPEPGPKGSILISNGSEWVPLAAGSDDQVLTADSSTEIGVKWADAGGGGLDLDGITNALTKTGTGGEAIAANLLVKLASDGKYYIWLYTDDPYLIYGVSATACAGNGSTFDIGFGSVEMGIKSDGTTAIAPGDRIEPSTTVNGRIKKGETNPIGISSSTVAATLDLLCQVRI